MILAHKEIAKVRADLHKIPVPDRKDTKTWKGVGHGVLADKVVERVEAQGMEISAENWYVNPKGSILWGAVDIIPGVASPELEIGQEANFSLGIRHGNDGEYAVSFAVGARIAICSNGMFHGDFVSKKRHTQTLDLEEIIDNALVKYIEECESLENLINGWRDCEVDDKDASLLMFEAHRRGYVNFRYLEDVFRNWSEPIHDEFQERTAWSLYNAFTEMAKGLTPPRQVKLLTGLRKLFDAEFNVADAYVGPQSLD